MSVIEQGGYLHYPEVDPDYRKGTILDGQRQPFLKVRKKVWEPTGFERKELKEVVDTIELAGYDADGGIARVNGLVRKGVKILGYGNMPKQGELVALWKHVHSICVNMQSEESRIAEVEAKVRAEYEAKLAMATSKGSKINATDKA